MKVYQKKFVQQLPVSLDEAWEFFSTPVNLDKLTPPDVYFKQTSLPLDKMYPGHIITYKISPGAGIFINWVTEITHIKDHVYFVDEQRSGPFSFFHHEHHFKAIDGGVEMTDLISYAVPVSFIGSIVNNLFVSNKLDEVFKFRQEKIVTLFGTFTIK